MKPLPHASHEKLSQGRRLALALIVLVLPLLLGGWKIIMEKDRGINPSYVDRIEDGKTKRTEILTLFGDPQEIKRTPEGMIYVYKAYRPKETAKKKSKDDKEPIGLSSVDSPQELEERLKKSRKKVEPTEELASTLTIYFKTDGETVQSHDFKQF
jgi:hypothetical protein